MNVIPPCCIILQYGGVLVKNYNVMLNGRIVGTAITESEGLYIRFRIQCTPPDTEIYRLIMLCGSQRMDLGVCVPENDLLCLNKCVQRKLLREGEFQFFLETRINENHMSFVPVDSENPFDYLDCLPVARFEKRDAVSGLLLPQAVSYTAP